MNRKYLRDDRFNIIGSIEADAGGKRIARDARFNRIGEYDPKSDKTRDSQFRIVGSGDQLSALI
jgi:hypothetical protein